MSEPGSSVRFLNPEYYTEASHHAYGIVDPELPSYNTGDELVRAKSVTARYACRATLGHAGWQPDGVEMSGDVVTAGQPPHHTTILLYKHMLRDWVADFAAAWFPHHVRLALPGHPAPTEDTASGKPADTPAPANLPVTGVTTYTEATYTTYADVAGAGPLLVPAHEPGRKDRWVLPEMVVVKYKQRSMSPIAAWQLADIRVTGPWCNDLGEVLPDAGGSGAWPGGTRPGWLDEFITAHTPTEGTGFTITT